MGSNRAKWEFWHSADIYSGWVQTSKVWGTYCIPQLSIVIWMFLDHLTFFRQLVPIPLQLHLKALQKQFRQSKRVKFRDFEMGQRSNGFIRKYSFARELELGDLWRIGITNRNSALLRHNSTCMHDDFHLVPAQPRSFAHLSIVFRTVLSPSHARISCKIAF